MTTSAPATSPSREAVLDLVRAALGVVCGRDERGIAPDTELTGIGVDSLGRVALAELVEERLAGHVPDLHIPDDVLADMRTVDDVVRYLVSQL